MTTWYTYCIHCHKELVRNYDASGEWLETHDGQESCPDETGEMFAHVPTTNTRLPK